MALRDGGLPSVSEAMGVRVRNGGYMVEGGSAPFGGGEAVAIFLNGIRRGVEEDKGEEE